MVLSTTLCAVLAVLAVLAACGGEAVEPELEVLVPGSDFHGIHGITVAPDGALLAGSVVGAATYRIDPESGAVETFLEPPTGMADDLEFSPDGETLAWTAFLLGKVFARTGDDGEIVELASGLPGANSLAWRSDGRLFFTQVFAGDALWELDPTGATEPRKIAEGLGGLNGFDFGPDGMLYGPIWFDHRVVRVDVDGGRVETVADGFGTPAAANFDSAGDLWVVDTERGEVVRVDPTNGVKAIVATVDPSIDNLALTPDDRLFITNMARNAIYEIDTVSGESRTVVEGALAMPGGLALGGVRSEEAERREPAGAETLHVADTFAYRTVDTGSGAVTDVRLMHAQSLEELDYPVNAWADEDHVLLTSWSSATVQVVDRQSGESLRMLHGFAAPSAALELPDGRIVVAQMGASNLVVLEDEAGEERRVVAEGFGLPTQLALAGASAVYLTDGVAGTVLRVDVDSGDRAVVADQLQQPEGVDVLPDGRLVVAEVGARRLVLIDPERDEDERVRELLAGLPIGLEAPPGLPPTYVLTGVAASWRERAIYFTSDLENAIYRVRY